jgi:hypothetical protein
MCTAVCHLLSGLTPSNANDYVYAAYFLICTTTFLQLRWWVGTSFMALPVLLVMSWQWRAAAVQLPPDSFTHMIIAWGGGALMAYLSEGYRRCGASDKSNSKVTKSGKLMMYVEES